MTSRDAAAWATSFARDQHACFIQNHKHDCTATCVKYEKKKQAADTTGAAPRAGQKISGSGVPMCRFRFYTYVALLIEGVVKYVMRRGKSLVPEAFVATGNEENEYGRGTPIRTMPFTSSSSDVLQAAIRCNADYQYQKRCVPNVNLSEQQEDVAPGADPPSSMVHLLCGIRSVLAMAITTTLATAMRAANVADFYMTKYQSKPQEKLVSIMQPFLAGMRRLEAEEAKETE